MIKKEIVEKIIQNSPNTWWLIKFPVELSYQYVKQVKLCKWTVPLKYRVQFRLILGLEAKRLATVTRLKPVDISCR